MVGICTPWGGETWDLATCVHPSRPRLVRSQTRRVGMHGLEFACLLACLLRLVSWPSPRRLLAGSPYHQTTRSRVSISRTSFCVAMGAGLRMLELQEDFDAGAGGSVLLVRVVNGVVVEDLLGRSR